ncbi:MAG: T9SS type A sorting domain-containing protein, partial [candidate division WOR-3 bacterium]
IQNPSGATANDWSTCNSVGPFTLAPGQTQTVAFAILGGTNLADLQANADTAYNRYWNWVGIKERQMSRSLNNITIIPNVSSGKFMLNYRLAQKCMINVQVYNIAGALVKNCDLPVDAVQGLMKLDFTDLGSGVYFVKIAADEEFVKEKIIIVK